MGELREPAPRSIVEVKREKELINDDVRNSLLGSDSPYVIVWVRNGHFALAGTGSSDLGRYILYLIE